MESAVNQLSTFHLLQELILILYLSGVIMKNELPEKENKIVDMLGMILFGAMILIAIIGVIILLFI